MDDILINDSHATIKNGGINIMTSNNININNFNVFNCTS